MWKEAPEGDAFRCNPSPVPAPSPWPCFVIVLQKFMMVLGVQGWDRQPYTTFMALHKYTTIYKSLSFSFAHTIPTQAISLWHTHTHWLLSSVLPAGYTRAHVCVPCEPWQLELAWLTEFESQVQVRVPALLCCLHTVSARSAKASLVSRQMPVTPGNVSCHSSPSFRRLISAH